MVEIIKLYETASTTSDFVLYSRMSTNEESNKFCASQLLSFNVQIGFILTINQSLD